MHVRMNLSRILFAFILMEDLLLFIPLWIGVMTLAITNFKTLLKLFVPQNILTVNLKYLNVQLSDVLKILPFNTDAATRMQKLLLKTSTAQIKLMLLSMEHLGMEQSAPTQLNQSVMISVSYKNVKKIQLIFMAPQMVFTVVKIELLIIL